MSPKEVNRYLDKENRKWPDELVEIPEMDWPPTYDLKQKPLRVLRSRKYLVQVFNGLGETIRLSCLKTNVKSDGRWEDGLSWEELMRLKEECGYGNACGVEVYPPNRDIVNVANMRHIWILPGVPPYVWRKK